MRIAIIICCLLLCNIGISQEDTTAEALNEVVLTAQRTKQKEMNVPYAIKTVTRSSLNELNPRTTPEALAGVNGVFVQKTNHGGGSAFVRGLTGNQTLVLIDGIRLNNSTFRYGPNQYLNTIDPYTINRIEVAKGTGSVQYGTDALGGVIQVITSDPEFAKKKNAVHGRLTSKYMTADMEKTVRGDISYSGSRAAFSGGIAYRKFGDLVGGDTTGRQRPSGYDEFSLDAKAKFAICDNTQLTISQQLLRQQHVPVYHKVVLEDFAVNEMHPQQRALSYARLNSQGKNRFFNQLEIIVSWQSTKEVRDSRKNGSTILRRERDAVNTMGVTADIFSSIKKGWTANSGIELYHDKINSTREDINTVNGSGVQKRGLYPDNARYGNYSLYSLHHFSIKRFIIDAGLRFNTFDIRLTDTSLGKVSISPSTLVANTALMYILNRHHHIYAAFSNGYRAPNIDDMGTLGIVDFRYELPTGNLEPERSQSFEAGYKYKSKKLAGTLSVYYMRLNNLITRVKIDGQVISGYPVYKKENVERAYIKGVEAELNWTVNKYFSMMGGMAYAYGQNVTRHEPLRRIPPLNGRVIATWRKAGWFAASEFLFASKQDRLAQGDKDDNRIPKGGTPDWSVHNMYVGYRFNKLVINLGLQNLFNEDYRTHGSGINGVGRSGWISVGIHF